MGLAAVAKGCSLSAAGGLRRGSAAGTSWVGLRMETTDSENVVVGEGMPACRSAHKQHHHIEPKQPLTTGYRGTTTLRYPFRGNFSSLAGARAAGAYVRVSSADQNEARQLEAVGECDQSFIEKESGRSRVGREHSAA